jgi:hypothetical protein
MHTDRNHPELIISAQKGQGKQGFDSPTLLTMKYLIFAIIKVLAVLYLFGTLVWYASGADTLARLAVLSFFALGVTITLPDDLRTLQKEIQHFLLTRKQ